MEIGFNLISSLAQLNLAYLAIVIAIVALIVGAFYLFSISPLRENLKEQKNNTINFKEKLSEKIDTIEQSLIPLLREEFKKEIKSSTITSQSIFQKELNKNKDDLNETTVKLLFSVDDKIEQLRSSDIRVVKELVTASEKTINNNEKSSESDINNLKKIIDSLKRQLKEMNYKILELEVYKFSKEGKMGSLYRLIDLVNAALEDERDYLIPKYLENMMENIDGYILTEELVSDISKCISKLDAKYFIQVDKIKELLKKSLENKKKGN